MPGFLDRLRGKKDDQPVDMEARSPETGLKYKDISLLGVMMKQGADLTKPRHVLYYLYFGTREAAEAAAGDGRQSGYSCDVRDPLPQYPGQWSVVCERGDAVLDIAGVRQADDLFQGIADRLEGEFDGWEAAV
jgi:ADP-ribose pyrophosphatase YjhB (NUDIX family)